MRILLYVVFAGLIIGSVWGNEDKEGEKVLSITEERRELLLYGIDSQILELLKDLREEKDDTLVGEVMATLKTSRNPTIGSAIIDYFREIDYEKVSEEVVVIVDTYEDQNTQLLLSAVKYLTDYPPPNAVELFSPLLDMQEQEIIRAALKGLGLSGDEAAVDILLDRIDDDDFHDNLKPEVILALGDLGHKKAIEPLISIIEDTGEEATWRRYACTSLGKIGDVSTLPVIENLLYDDDSILRSYAVGALRYFESDDIIPMLNESLKDSFWRVRVSAAQGLAEKNVERAVPILIFKAEKDPEMNVRLEAAKALGTIANGEALEALRRFYENDLTPQPIRLIAAESLTDKDLENSLEVFMKVIDRHWGKDTSRILERTAKILSLADSSSLERFYERFLGSGELVVIIYGIRGIGRNNIGSLREAVEKLAEEGNHRSIRKEALAALEQLD